MADLKISQLTGATTPLAGTEVVPVVQSSTTKKVAVSDLTAGRDVNAKSIALTGVAATGYLSMTAGGTTTNYNLGQITNTGGGLYWGVDNNAGTAFGGNTAYGGVVATSTATDLSLGVNNAVKWRISNATGDLVQVVAGDGVNFTANTPAAGMTSQLLNWYEEGTWTPVLSATTTPPTASYGNRTARYTLVGRLVTISLWMNISSQSGGSGTAEITGLPFTSANLSGANVSAVTVANYQNVDPGAGNVFTPYVLDNSTKIRFGYSGQAGGGYGDLAIGSIGASNITFTLTASYIV